MRRTGIARGASELKRTEMPRATKPMPRTSRLAARSKRMAAIYVKRRKLVAELMADNPPCVYPGCDQLGVDPHEPLTRARGGSILDPANVVPICRPHHDWCDAHPIEAEALGLLRWSWSASDPHTPTEDTDD